MNQITKVKIFDIIEPHKLNCVGGIKYMLGKIVTVDRAMGTYHPEHPDMYYPINYGYISGIIAPDGEEQDAYIIGVDKPVQEFTGKIIAIIHRNDDVED